MGKKVGIVSNKFFYYLDNEYWYRCWGYSL